MKNNFKATLEKFDSQLWTFHVKVPLEIASGFKQKGIKRFIATFNEKENIHCAIMHDQDGPFILINATVRKKLELQEGSEFSISLEEDKSQYGMEMPEELEACLLDNEVANNHFKDLTAGNQRNLIHLVNQVKDSSIRIRRSLSILDHLEREKGLLDFKKLHELIKEYNQKHSIS